MNDYNELIERCKEILEWKKTGLLNGDALREYANRQPYGSEYNKLAIAEAVTLKDAAEAFVELAARIAELESSLAATSDMVNKAFADGKAEGHGDATEEASVVIGELRARVAELEAERRTPRVRIEWKIEGDSGHGEWFPSHSRTTLADYCKVMDDNYGTGSHRVVDEPYSPVTAPVRLTHEQIKEIANEPGDTIGCAYIDALRANGFKVEE